MTKSIAAVATRLEVEFFDPATDFLPDPEAIGSQLRVTLLLEDMNSLEEISHILRSRLLRKASRSFRTVDGDAALVEVRQRGFRLHCRFVPGSLSGYAVTCVGGPR